ncbi:hypothetical protein PanWU01x14_127800, partial [Parasponia andersonii]
TQVLELNYMKKTRLRSTKTKNKGGSHSNSSCSSSTNSSLELQKITYSHSSFETLQPRKVSRGIQKESKDLPTWFSPSSKDSARLFFSEIVLQEQVFLRRSRANLFLQTPQPIVNTSAIA